MKRYKLSAVDMPSISGRSGMCDVRFAEDETGGYVRFADVEPLLTEREVMRKALEFYAAERSWLELCPDANPFDGRVEVDHDKGAFARAALASIEGKEEKNHEHRKHRAEERSRRND